MGVNPNSSEASLLDKHKGKAGKTSLSFLPSSGVNVKLWNLEFSTCELDKKVTMAGFIKDHDTCTGYHATERRHCPHQGKLEDDQGSAGDAS